MVAHWTGTSCAGSASGAARPRRLVRRMEVAALAGIDLILVCLMYMETRVNLPFNVCAGFVII